MEWYAFHERLERAKLCFDMGTTFVTWLSMVLIREIYRVSTTHILSYMNAKRLFEKRVVSIYVKKIQTKRKNL